MPTGAKSRMRRTETPKPIWIKFCTMVDITNIVICTNFGDHRLRGFWVAGRPIPPFPIDFHRRPFNTVALPCECVMTRPQATAYTAQVVLSRKLWEMEITDYRPVLCANISPLTMSAHLRKFSIPDHKRLLIYAWKCLVVSRLSGQLRYANASF